MDKGFGGKIKNPTFVFLLFGSGFARLGDGGRWGYAFYSIFAPLNDCYV